MILLWRGWGIAVFFAWLLWLVSLVGMVIAFGGHQPVSVTEAEGFDWLVGLSFAMTALSVLGIDRYRRNHPRHVVDPATERTCLVANVDDFMLLPLRVWVYLLLAAALGMGIAGILGYGPD